MADLELTAPGEKRPHKRVRSTSAMAYEHGREHFTGRKGDVLRHLAHYWNRHNESPTSAELAKAVWNWRDQDGKPNWMVEKFYSWDAMLLWVRRGLSDLDATGAVESPDKRLCRVTGKTCVTWRVRERGTPQLHER